MIKKKIVVIDFCNFEDYPMGGYLTFERNMMKSFGENLILIGITTVKSDPVGKWFKKEIDGKTYDFFALARYNKNTTKHIIPDRLAIYILLKFYKKRILRKKIDNVFIQRPEILICINKFNFKNICFCSAGMENPLSISKFWYARYISRYFDKAFFACLNTVNVFLATGDEESINEFIVRSENKISRASIKKFPSRIDTNIFKPIDKNLARNSLDIQESDIIISCTGRLAWFKGWKFLVDSFQEFQKITPDSKLYFIGEGEDYEKIKKYIDSKNLSHKIIFTGSKTPREISLYLNASDLFVMGSYKEGWSTTLLEAMACGVPTCTTNFSSASSAEAIAAAVSLRLTN